MIGALSRYKIIEKLGAGGMGEVYKAEDPTLLRTVAIKVISKKEAGKPDAQVRFLREARAASSVSHPNIVTIYEIGETDDKAFIVMEYIEGHSLRQLLLSRQVPVDQIPNIALQICDALSEAHSRGVIHRDIKPENILLTPRGQVKVLDFGLAKSVDREGGIAEVQSLTGSGTVMGTLSYMSPEQLRGEELDARTDIFSFGLVLYELIAGRFAFAGGTPFEVAASILKEEARGIDYFPPGLSPGFENIVSRLLAKSKDSRFRSFKEVRESISALIQEQSADTVELTTGYISKVSEPRVPSGIPTILVMPLETVGGEAGSYIGVGLAHAITTDLAKINGLSVLSKFAGAGRPGEGNRTDRELARDLGATILLEGEIVRSGPTIGVMARLIDVETGRVIWGSQYRGDASDLFSIQDAVCENVAGALKISVSNDLRSGIGRPATRSIEAFELYSKGRAFLERRDVAQNIDYAIQVFQEALNLDSEYAPAYAGLGEAYWLKYEISRDNAWVDRALAATDHALTLDPGEPRVYMSLGIIYHGTGKIERAREQFERAIQLQPTGDEAYQWLGRCCLRQGEVDPAITYFKKAIEIRPGYWGNYSALGACYSTFGRYREAAEQFRKVITFQPDNFLGYDDLGGIYYLLGQYEDAARMYRRAIEIYPNHRSYSNLGTACFYLGRYDESISAYRSAIELNSRNDSHHYNLGDVYLRLGRIEEGETELRTACELLRENLTVNPDDARSLGRLGLVLAKLGRNEEAIANITRAAQLEQKNPTLLYLNAVVHTLCGNERAALEWLGRALAGGYSRSEVHRDPDLEGLRHLPEYRALIEAADSFKTN